MSPKLSTLVCTFVVCVPSLALANPGEAARPGPNAGPAADWPMLPLSELTNQDRTALKAPSAIFRGSIVSIGNLSSHCFVECGQTFTLTFSVGTVWKGIVDTLVDVDSSSGMLCNAPRMGETYLVFARGAGKRFTSIGPLCSAPAPVNPMVSPDLLALYQKNLSALERAAVETPSDLAKRLELAYFLEEWGDPERALVTYQAIRADFPLNADAMAGSVRTGIATSLDERPAPKFWGDRPVIEHPWLAIGVGMVIGFLSGQRRQARGQALLVDPLLAIAGAVIAGIALQGTWVGLWAGLAGATGVALLGSTGILLLSRMWRRR